MSYSGSPFGSITVSSTGITLQNSTSGYSPTALNYYEEVSTSGSSSGCVSTTVNYTLSRIGKKVTYTINTEITSLVGSNSALAFPSIPARYRPSTYQNIPYFFRDNGTWVTGILQINTNGSMLALRDPGGTPPTGLVVDFPPCSFSYNII